MTARRTLGPGPQPAPIKAAQADLIAELPGRRLPDLAELRDRGFLGARSTSAPAARRTLGDGANTATQ
ncbi:hypothetical protein ACIGO8_30730 [Streptomyces sp. NPDC053493]|uniref:hypothetical protein n=1 Tax=Streptomyces sp. NPDC053493 TaxID=3365705 RepID=UPI0037CE87F9